MTRPILKTALAAAVVAAPLAVFTASHREAPITALDRAADITDWYTFVSYDDPSKLDDDPVGRPAARAGQRPELLPLRPRHPLRDAGRQQPRRRAGRHAPVPLPEPAAEPRRVHRLRRRARWAFPRSPRSMVRGQRGWASGRPTPSPPSAAISVQPERRPGALRRAEQRRAPDHAQLPGSLRPGHLQPGQRHPGVRRHHRRPLLHRPGRGLRLAQLPARGRRRRPSASATPTTPSTSPPTTSPATTSTPSPSRFRSPC